MDIEVTKQLDVLLPGLAELISEEELARKIDRSLRTQIPLRVKFGADPSAPDLHLGHSVPLEKLRQLQELGHTVIFLVGDFTAMIGDPSGQNDTRPPLTADQVKENAATYTEQCFKILDRKRVEIAFNSSWCGKLTFTDIIRLSSEQTVARILERDDFAKRYKANRPIHMHELLYPLVQGYDSVMLKADIEMCGTDQKFNCLLARDMQERAGQEPEVIMITPLLVGLDGERKMSKSLDNYVGLTQAPGEMFGRLMSVSDELMYEYYRFLLGRSPDQVAQMQRAVAEGKAHPKQQKEELAEQIAAKYHSADEAHRAREDFQRVFSKGQLPDDITSLKLDATDIGDAGISLSLLIVKAGLAKSRSSAKRLINDGAVSLDGTKVTEQDPNLKPADGAVLRVGKRGFARIVTGG
jgi:tyrosyl-tRNA synthetase